MSVIHNRPTLMVSGEVSGSHHGGRSVKKRLANMQRGLSHTRLFFSA